MQFSKISAKKHLCTIQFFTYRSNFLGQNLHVRNIIQTPPVWCNATIQYGPVVPDTTYIGIIGLNNNFLILRCLPLVVAAALRVTRAFQVFCPPDAEFNGQNVPVTVLTVPFHAPNDNLGIFRQPQACASHLQHRVPGLVSLPAGESRVFWPERAA